MARMKWRANMINAFGQMFLMWNIASYCEGFIAGRLPFKPFSFVSQLTHRGLSGEDMQDCSLFAVFIMAQAAFRGSISKLLGNPEGPRMPMDY